MIDGKLYACSDILKTPRAQLAASATPEQPALFELLEDRRPATQTTTAGRYAQPSLFDI